MNRMISKARRELAEAGLTLHVSRKANGEPALYGARWYITRDGLVTSYGDDLAQLGD